MAETIHNLEDENYLIDISKYFYILWHRKKWMILTIALTMICTLIFTLISPKKYKVESILLVNKASSTNLSDINPFIVSDVAKASGGIASMLGGVGLNDEIQIITSPLVIEPVIQENNLKYTEGKRAGNYLSVNAFLLGGFKVEQVKDTNTLSISYKSTSPQKAYRIVNSVINHYQQVYEAINLHKARKDKEFLEKFYIKTKQSLENKWDVIKDLPPEEALNQQPTSNVSFDQLYKLLLSKKDKRLQEEINKAPEQNIETRKRKLEIDQEISNLNELKTKYEWSILVENMAKNTANIIVLKKPEVPKLYDNIEPKLILNLIFGILVSVILAAAVVCFLELKDTKLTFSNLLDKTSTVYNNAYEIDYTQILINIAMHNIKHLGIVLLTDDKNTTDIQEGITKHLLNAVGTITVSTPSHHFIEHINNIKESDGILFIAQVNTTPRDQYKSLHSYITNTLKKLIVSHCVINCKTSPGF